MCFKLLLDCTVLRVATCLEQTGSSVGNTPEIVHLAAPLPRPADSIPLQQVISVAFQPHHIGAAVHILSFASRREDEKASDIGARSVTGDQQTRAVAAEFPGAPVVVTAMHAKAGTFCRHLHD